MSEKSRSDLKALFATGATADSSDFDDLIDSSPNYSDDIGAFFRVFSSASSTADARSLLNITAGGTVAAALNDLEDVSAQNPDDGATIYYVSADGKWQDLPTGAIGRELLAASATSSVLGHLGLGTVGELIVASDTTASVQEILGISPTTFGSQIISVSATSSLKQILNYSNGPTFSLIVPAGTTTLSTAHGLSNVDIVSMRLEVVNSTQGCSPGQIIHSVRGDGFAAYVSGDNFHITYDPGLIFTNPAGSSRTVSAGEAGNYKIIASVHQL